MFESIITRLRSIGGHSAATVSLPGPPPVSSAASPQAHAREPYTAASRAPRAGDWGTSDPPATVATLSAAMIRARCRDAMRNDAWARAIVETLVDDVIGWGVKPLSRSTDERTRQLIQRRWEDWGAVADADGLLDIAGLQALAVRTWAVDGECFIRLRPRKREDGLPVPLQLQVLPAEICDETKTDGANIRAGIEYDTIGRRVAYWLRDAVPGDDLSRVASSIQSHRVPASQVLHLFDPMRPGQGRGVSLLAPALVRLRELDKYADATLLRLQLSNMFVAFLKTQPRGGDPMLHPLTGEPVPAASDGSPTLTMRAGALQELAPGEEVEFNDPPAPPLGFAEYVRHELRAAGAAVGVPLEAFTHDWGATNDRLARVVLNQYRRRVHRILWTLVVPQFLRPLWATWIQRADFADVDIAQHGGVTFAPHAHAYVHPVQDVASYREAIRAGLTSRAAAVSETGEDVEVIDAQIAADNARADRLKLSFDSDGRVEKSAKRTGGR